MLSMQKMSGVGSVLLSVKRLLRKPLIVTGYIGYYCSVAYCVTEYVGDFVICQGPSMEPTIHSNDVMLTEHISVIRKRMRKGDIVVSKSPTNPRLYVCKRVKALPGDRVKRGASSSYVVPSGHVWLEGDNRDNSTDSRTYGPVPMGLIRSRAVCRVWPVEKMMVFPRS